MFKETGREGLESRREKKRGGNSRRASHTGRKAKKE